MSGNKALLDTNILIYASKRKLNTEVLLSGYDEFYVSIITYIEVYGYEFGSLQEKKLVDQLFESIEIIEIDKAIAEQTIEYRKNKSRKIKLPDAIILATASCLKADLVTNNRGDFEGQDDKVVLVNMEPLAG